VTARLEKIMLCIDWLLKNNKSAALAKIIGFHWLSWLLPLTLRKKITDNITLNVGMQNYQTAHIHVIRSYSQTYKN